MKKTPIATAIMAIAITLGLTCCGGSSSDATVTGLWKASAVVYYSAADSEGQSAPIDWTETLQLNEDGTYTGSWQMGDSTGTTSGTYTVADGVLTLTDPNSSSMGLILTEEELTLIGNMPEGSFHLTYIRQ